TRIAQTEVRRSGIACDCARDCSGAPEKLTAERNQLAIPKISSILGMQPRDERHVCAPQGILQPRALQSLPTRSTWISLATTGGSLISRTNNKTGPRPNAGR